MSRERGNLDSFGGQSVNVTETADPDDPTHWRQVTCSVPIFLFSDLYSPECERNMAGQNRSKQKQEEPA